MLPPLSPRALETGALQGDASGSRLHLEAPKLANQVEEERLRGAGVLCGNHAALSDGAFALNIENA